jgi:membrane protease YdiL (CAAX protease family)
VKERFTMQTPMISTPPPVGPRPRKASAKVQWVSAWMLFLSFLTMIPMEYASLDWEKTSAGTWRIVEGDHLSLSLALFYGLWALWSMVGTGIFLVAGVVNRFTYERPLTDITWRDLIYFLAWVQCLSLLLSLPFELFPGAGDSMSLLYPYLPHLIILGLGLTLFHRRLHLLGFRRPKSYGWMVFAIILLYAVVFFQWIDQWITNPVARYFSLELDSWREDSISQGIQQAGTSGWGALAGQIVMLGMLGPIAEEILFRGVLQEVLRRRVGVWLSVLLSSVLFALFHVDVALLAPLLVLGLILGSLKAVFRSLWAPILFHMVNNTTSVIMELLHR